MPRVDLSVPYAEKAEAKALGAWWDPAHKTWYVPEGCETPAEKFERWMKRLPESPTEGSGASRETIGETIRAKPKQRVDSYDGGRTGPRELKEGCGCEVLPWDDCEHTRTT